MITFNSTAPLETPPDAADISVVPGNTPVANPPCRHEGSHAGGGRSPRRRRSQVLRAVLVGAGSFELQGGADGNTAFCGSYHNFA
jgi:hypothetical protein